MRVLADVHIAPRTVQHLRSLGHDVVRASDPLPASAPDHAIVEEAIRDSRVILTQDLDFTAIVAVSGERRPSVISLRLTSSRVEEVNECLARVLPLVEGAVKDGALVTVEDSRIRTRMLPVA